MPIYPYTTKGGKKRYQAVIVDKRRGLPRVKRSFKTRAAADDWLNAAAKETHRRYIGERERHTFGEALAKYLAEESPLKDSRRDDVSNAAALRYPVWDGRRFMLLEHTPLEDMVAALAAWLTDQRLVTRRRYFGAELYLERANPDGTRAWYYQPEPADGETPRARELVKDRALLEKLDEPGGRGPFSRSTLRVRQVLVGRILRLCWKRWGWLGADIAGQVELEKPGKGRELFLTEEQLERLITAAAGAIKQDGTPDPVGPHFADAINAAALIGWRRANLLMLDWERVVFPVYEDTSEGRRMVQVGVIWVKGDDTKNEEDLAYPIGDELLKLLERRWELRMPYTNPATGKRQNLVFHDGRGQGFGDFRRRYATAKRAAGVRADFRWHDLRHTWASHMIQSGASDRHVQELGGWKTLSMVKLYSKLNVEHLLESVNKMRSPR